MEDIGRKNVMDLLFKLEIRHMHVLPVLSQNYILWYKIIAINIVIPF